MNTVIFKWNPSFSNFTMYDYLAGIVSFNMPGHSMKYNWAVWDYKDIRKGDRYYFVKLGPNGTGIIGRGTIKSLPWAGKDWSGKGRDTRYVDLNPEIFINPDALPIITTSMLEARIPDFEWDHGHSGKILPEEAANQLEGLWHTYIEQHGELLREKADSTEEYNDKIYWKR